MSNSALGVESATQLMQHVNLSLVLNLILNQREECCFRVRASHLKVTKKRTLEEKNETREVTKPDEDKKKSASDEPASPPLSREQLDRIERNRTAALQRLAARNVPPGFGESWQEALGEEFAKPYFSRLMCFVAEERKRHTVYPPPDCVFSWTQMCSIHHVKVVILGQDPYHGPGQAHGLCFSAQRPSRPQVRLENVYRELADDVEGFQHPGHGDLTGWAKQGVLLLNSVLTVRAHQASSHLDRGWESFTNAAVAWLSANLRNLVFLLWGGHAHRKGEAIDRKRHHILQTAHPSPLSVHRGFFGCRHFSKTNRLLITSGRTPIDWTAL
ncbi:hypothetical protein AAFF_G00054520 [Aldrovandia affinis]|uniref:Uracil-DNA glycosylase n=1 Tax=Aldrovandia affinis TaxID=143900 RepID=A0AAD7S0V9_9TELE|nr:hypothetical protein AAFF_G00054520 [Aldrovandia affinis]